MRIVTLAFVLYCCNSSIHARRIQVEVVRSDLHENRLDSGTVSSKEVTNGLVDEAQVVVARGNADASEAPCCSCSCCSQPTNLSASEDDCGDSADHVRQTRFLIGFFVFVILAILGLILASSRSSDLTCLNRVATFASILCAIDCTVFPVLLTVLPFINALSKSDAAAWLHIASHACALWPCIGEKMLELLNYNTSMKVADTDIDLLLTDRWLKIMEGANELDSYSWKQKQVQRVCIALLKKKKICKKGEEESKGTTLALMVTAAMRHFSQGIVKGRSWIPDKFCTEEIVNKRKLKAEKEQAPKKAKKAKKKGNADVEGDAAKEGTTGNMEVDAAKDQTAVKLEKEEKEEIAVKMEVDGAKKTAVKMEVDGAKGTAAKLEEVDGAEGTNVKKEEAVKKEKADKKGNATPSNSTACSSGSKSSISTACTLGPIDKTKIEPIVKAEKTEVKKEPMDIVRGKSQVFALDDDDDFFSEAKRELKGELDPISQVISGVRTSNEALRKQSQFEGPIDLEAHKFKYEFKNNMKKVQRTNVQTREVDFSIFIGAEFCDSKDLDPAMAFFSDDSKHMLTHITVGDAKAWSRGVDSMPKAASLASVTLSTKKVEGVKADDGEYVKYFWMCDDFQRVRVTGKRDVTIQLKEGLKQERQINNLTQKKITCLGLRVKILNVIAKAFVEKTVTVENMRAIKDDMVTNIINDNSKTTLEQHLQRAIAGRAPPADGDKTNGDNTTGKTDGEVGDETVGGKTGDDKTDGDDGDKTNGEVGNKEGPDGEKTDDEKTDDGKADEKTKEGGKKAETPTLKQAMGEPTDDEDSDSSSSSSSSKSKNAWEGDDTQVDEKAESDSDAD